MGAERRTAQPAAFLFPPAAAVVGILVLASERASRCLTYGEQCASGLPGWLFGWGTGIGVVALLVAVASPTVRIRRAGLAVQVLAECTMLLVIVSHA